MRRVLLISLLAAAGWSAYTQSLPDGPLETLLTVPDTLPADAAGGIIEYAEAPPAPTPVAGRHTIIEFYDVRCRACGKLNDDLRVFTRLRPDVAVRKYPITRPLARAYRVASIPHVLLYDSGGRLLAADRGPSKVGLHLLYDWMNTELDRHEARRQNP